jgi:ATP-dependent Clp protease protease subunit
MIGTIFIQGEIGVDCTLLDVIKQVKAQSAAESFLVKVDSVGGFVDSGKDIYNYLVNLSVPVTTFTTKAYSIASMIFMAGSTRIIPEGSDNALMIHLPWMEAVGNHQVISDYLKDLKATEDELVDFYAKALQLDKNTIHSLLNQETYLNATQSIELGFATQLQPAQLAVAKLHNNKDQKEESLMNKLEKKLDSIMNMLTGKAAIKAELVLQDATGVSITFPDLSGSDVPVLEDKAMIDSKPAEGEFTMPDNTIYTFKGGAVAEIETPKEEETEPVEPAMDAVSGDTMPTETIEPDADEPLLAELQAKITELQGIIDQLMSAEDQETLLNALEKSVEKQTDLETKFNALAKQIGSDFQPSQKDNKTSIKASVEIQSRATQILNSKF